MKASKKVAVAVGAATLGLIAATGVTSGFAWFTAANTVTVNGLQFQAAAEEGIVISNSDKNSWTTTASAKHNGAGAAFIPTSTADFSTWYHALSDSATNGQSGVMTYEVFSIEEAAAEGVKKGTTTNQVTAAKNVYLLNEFYIQSAGAYTINAQDIYVQDLIVTATATGESASTELNRSLRVGVKHGSKATVFAPVANATTSYTVNGATAVTAITSTATVAPLTTAEVAESVNIPTYDANGTGALQFNVYIWFEGEDLANKSANITANLDSLDVSFKFGNKNHDTNN